MAKQLDLNIYRGRNGGPRPGSGRPRTKSRGVAHERREIVTAHTPFHINFKYNLSIRTEVTMLIMGHALKNAQKHHLNVICYTIQWNHIHLIGEAPDTASLISGMRSLTNTIVKRLDKGSIQIERYHLHVLKTPAEVRHAIAYVLLNDLKHTGKFDKRFTKMISRGECWLLKKATSSLKDIASATLLKLLCP